MLVLTRLILTRKEQESIIIGPNIRITVLEIDRNKVRLGIEAPKEVRIDREEVYRAMHGDEADWWTKLPPDELPRF